MNIVEQLKSAVESGAKISLTIFLSAVAALLVEHRFPDWFSGFPAYVLPAVRLTAIFFGVVALVPIALWVLHRVRLCLAKLGKLVGAPIRKAVLRNKLLNLSKYELAVMCCAIAREDRNVWLKADATVTLLLLENGLIQYWTYGMGHQTCYQIDMDAWRQMLSMKEFAVENRVFWASYLSAGYPPDQIERQLPKAHPSTPK